MTEFDPTAGLTDFDSIPGLRAAWSKNVNDMFESNNYGSDEGSALSELQRWGYSDADIRFFNPLSMPIPAQSKDANVTWQALPTSFDSAMPDKKQRFQYLDTQHLDPRPNAPSRVQDEYNEWTVFRSGQKITKVVFTCEPAAYYDFLGADPSNVGKELTRGLLLKLYRDISGDASIQLPDLFKNGRFNPWNKWNAKYCIHMQQWNNALDAEVNIAARSALLRKDVQTGRIKTDAFELIQCGAYGQAERQSDPSIGSAVNAAVRENRFITLQNPVGLYMTGIDTTGWVAPDGTDPQTFWHVARGSANADPLQSRIVRAEFSVPAQLGYTVSDIKIGDDSIDFGAQIAAGIGMRLGVTVSPPSGMPPPRAIGCVQDTPPPLSHVAANAARSSRA